MRENFKEEKLFKFPMYSNYGGCRLTKILVVNLLATFGSCKLEIEYSG